MVLNDLAGIKLQSVLSILRTSTALYTNLPLKDVKIVHVSRIAHALLPAGHELPVPGRADGGHSR